MLCQVVVALARGDSAEMQQPGAGRDSTAHLVLINSPCLQSSREGQSVLGELRSPAKVPHGLSSCHLPMSSSSGRNGDSGLTPEANIGAQG